MGELKNPKTGSGTDGGEETAATWQYYQDMHEVLGGRPSIDPPLLVTSFTPDDPTTILLAESEREQRRHEESEAKTERFLRLFEQMVEKI
ncbi:hypothetical protein SKAU_G00247850 [Synaphobranchus kaupii]|uniref:Uncharacterized protein n=1 Tax=Synaphobranchus kaupii TaxID=118154 RepID=A0A9Q1IRK5_SYNKA|nr:hypothetical protein SKAU_G00247850 [Synaphobranchus kaupii]